jgi:hypothetical protein
MICKYDRGCEYVFGKVWGICSARRSAHDAHIWPAGAVQQPERLSGSIKCFDKIGILPGVHTTLRFIYMVFLLIQGASEYLTSKKPSQLAPRRQHPPVFTASQVCNQRSDRADTIKEIIPRLSKIIMV